MKKVPSKVASAKSHKRIVKGKEKWHDQLAKESFSMKIRSLDKMFERAKVMSAGKGQLIPTHNRIEARLEINHIGSVTEIAKLEKYSASSDEIEPLRTLETGGTSWTSTSHSYAITPRPVEK